MKYEKLNYGTILKMRVGKSNTLKHFIAYSIYEDLHLFPIEYRAPPLIKQRDTTLCTQHGKNSSKD